jgi:hypothetical protein
MAGGGRSAESWDDLHAHEPRRLGALTDVRLAEVGGLLTSDVVLLLSVPLKGDRMEVCRSWGRVAAGIPPELFAPPGSLLANVARSVGSSRLRLLPLLGVPGSGQGRGMGSTLSVCDGGGGLLLVARLPHRPAFSAGDLGSLRDLLSPLAGREGLW